MTSYRHTTNPSAAFYTYTYVWTCIFSTLWLQVLLIKFGVPKKKTDKKKKKDKDKDKDKSKDNKVGPTPRKRGPPPKRQAFSP